MNYGGLNKLISHRLGYFWTLTPKLEMLSGEVVKPLGGGAMLEEGHPWAFTISPNIQCLPLLCSSIKMWALRLLLLLSQLPLAATPPCHHGLLSPWNHKPKETFPSVNWNGNVLTQQEKNTRKTHSSQLGPGGCAAAGKNLTMLCFGIMWEPLELWLDGCL